MPNDGMFDFVKRENQDEVWLYEENDQLLHKWFNEGKSEERIAEEMKRSPQSIQPQVWKLCTGYRKTHREYSRRITEERESRFTPRDVDAFEWIAKKYSRKKVPSLTFQIVARHSAITGQSIDNVMKHMRTLTEKKKRELGLIRKRAKE